MPYLKEEDLANLYKEIDTAKSKIDTLSDTIEEEEEQISILKKHRMIIGIFAVLATLLMIWSFLPKEEEIPDEYLIRNNLSLVNTDSLHSLQLELDKLKSIESSRVTVSELPIVYSVQIGAYNNFSSDLFSEDFSHLTEFSQEGMNKFALGNYKTYKEAVNLRTDLKKLGFIDCFIIAKSYGKPISIKEALDLSGEEWIRGE
ncbi:MAG: hypothetical protein DSY82_08905 [Flavobacteriia bacterium]|nr:MAG: hypothetical protein DSY82_08905 [Flavobacteriia bacterium]